jgi:hypothetical protein
LFLDLFLLALELQELFLRFLHLRIEMLSADTVVFVEFQHLFDWAEAFRHDVSYGGATPGTLDGRAEIARFFHREIRQSLSFNSCS